MLGLLTLCAPLQDWRLGLACTVVAFFSLFYYLSPLASWVESQSKRSSNYLVTQWPGKYSNQPLLLRLH